MPHQGCCALSKHCRQGLKPLGAKLFPFFSLSLFPSSLFLPAMKMQCLCIQQVQAPLLGSKHKRKKKLMNILVWRLDCSRQTEKSQHNLRGWNTEDKHKHEDYHGLMWSEKWTRTLHTARRILLLTLDKGALWTRLQPLILLDVHVDICSSWLQSPVYTYIHIREAPTCSNSTFLKLTAKFSLPRISSQAHPQKRLQNTFSYKCLKKRSAFFYSRAKKKFPSKLPKEINVSRFLWQN